MTAFSHKRKYVIPIKRMINDDILNIPTLSPFTD